MFWCLDCWGGKRSEGRGETAAGGGGQGQKLWHGHSPAGGDDFHKTQTATKSCRFSHREELKNAVGQCGHRSSTAASQRRALPERPDPPGAQRGGVSPKLLTTGREGAGPVPGTGLGMSPIQPAPLVPLVLRGARVEAVGLPRPPSPPLSQHSRPQRRRPRQEQQRDGERGCGLTGTASAPTQLHRLHPILFHGVRS